MLFPTGAGHSTIISKQSKNFKTKLYWVPGLLPGLRAADLQFHECAFTVESTVLSTLCPEQSLWSPP